MAANLDRAETSLTAVSDVAYLRGIDSSGNSVRISKADLASVLGGIFGINSNSRSVLSLLTPDTQPSNVTNFEANSIRRAYESETQGLPSGIQYCYVLTIGSMSGDGIQLALSFGITDMFFRKAINGGITAWYRINMTQV